MEALIREQREQLLRNEEEELVNDPWFNDTYQYNSETCTYEPRPRDPNSPTWAQRIVPAKKFVRAHGGLPASAALRTRPRPATGRPIYPNQPIENGPVPGENPGGLDTIFETEEEHEATREAEVSSLWNGNRPRYLAAVPAASMIRPQLEEGSCTEPAEGTSKARGSGRVAFGKHEPLAQDGETQPHTLTQTEKQQQ